MGRKIRPELPRDLPGAWAEPLKAADLPITASLLDLVENEHLVRLVHEALKNNPDLAATALRLGASELLLQQTRAARMPSATLSGTRSRDNHGFDSITGKRASGNRYGLSLNLNWELDIWGRLADVHDARTAVHEMKRQDFVFAYDSLAARVIQSWIHAAGTRRVLGIEKQRLEALEKIETVILKRYRNGLGSLSELSAARSRANVARAGISRLNAEYRKGIRSMEVLLGRFSTSEDMDGIKMPDIALAAISTPPGVLGKRPDIRAALARIDRDTLAALAARKKMLPSLSLGFRGSKQAGSLSSLGGSDIIYNLIGNMVQPLFQGKRLVNAAQAASLEADAAVAELRGLVLTAVKEVEDRAGKEKDLQSRQGFLTRALKEARKTTLYYRTRYANGLETLPVLLTAVEQEMNIQGQLISVRSARMKNRVDLALALGMGANFNHGGHEPPRNGSNN